LEIKYFIFINYNVYAVGMGGTKIYRRYNKSQLKENGDEAPACFRIN